MEIDIHLQPSFEMLADNRIFDRFDRRLLLGAWVRVKSIQVEAIGIKSPVAARYSVGVKAGDDLEDIVLQKGLGLRIFSIHEEVEEALKHVASGSFARVDSGGQENHWGVIG